jgi:hypothetical protein
MTVAVIMLVLFSRLAEWAKGGGSVPSLVVMGERGGEAVQQPALPKRPMDFLKRGLPVGAALVESADAPLEGAKADRLCACCRRSGEF